jgi:hypothetical protein
MIDLTVHMSPQRDCKRPVNIIESRADLLFQGAEMQVMDKGEAACALAPLRRAIGDPLHIFPDMARCFAVIMSRR